MEEIIGYKLIKPEYESVAVQIGARSGLNPFNDEYNVFYKDFKTIPVNGFKDTIENLKKAGVLDIWFEPVYKETKKYYTVRYDDGLFMVTVEGECISSEEDNVTCSLHVIKALIAPRLDEIVAFNDSHIEVVRYPEKVDIGCKKGILVKDLREIVAQNKT